jgi:hypothetical protein
MAPTRQDTFRAALLDPGAPVPGGLTDGAGRDAGQRFNVYRNNVAASLTEAMKTGFPVITKLLGEANMDGLSGLFLRAHPPTSPLMMHYGAAFPGFMEAMEQLSHLPYLGDVARLELALRASYHAADAPPIAPEALAEIEPKALLRTRLHLAPALRVVSSRWPIHGIWRFNTDTDAPKPEPRAEDVLILRPDYDPVPHLLPPGGAVFVARIAAGDPMGPAHDAALTTAPDFDLGLTLGLLLQGGAITHLDTKD